MMQLNDTVLRNKGQHLTLSERIEIQSMNRQGFSNRQIAMELSLVSVDDLYYLCVVDPC